MSDNPNFSSVIVGKITPIEDEQGKITGWDTTKTINIDGDKREIGNLSNTKWDKN